MKYCILGSIPNCIPYCAPYCSPYCIPCCIPYCIPYCTPYCITGCIPAEEIQFVLRHLPGRISEEEMREMVKTLDRNRDGSISFSEFRLWDTETLISCIFIIIIANIWIDHDSRRINYALNIVRNDAMHVILVNEIIFMFFFIDVCNFTFYHEFVTNVRFFNQYPSNKRNLKNIIYSEFYCLCYFLVFF